MKSVLVLGAGMMGKTHICAYQKMKNVKLLGVVDIQQPELTGIDKSQVFSTFEEAISRLGNVDIVDICLPTFLHKEFVKKAASLGKHIICEKPLARTLADAKEIIDSCKENNVFLFVGHVVRFFPEYVQAKEFVNSGEIGNVNAVKTFRNSSFPKAWNDWYSNHENSGGLILDLIIHDFDFLRWCFGEVKQVSAKSNYDSKKECAFVTLLFENGITAFVEGSWSDEKFSSKYEISGDKGNIKFDSTQEHSSVSIVKNGLFDQSDALKSQVKESPYYRELEHYIYCIENDKTPILTPEDGYEAVKIALAAIKSLEIKEPVLL